MMRRSLVVLTGVLLVGACTFTGTKGGTPGWKIYKEEHDRPVPPALLRAGDIDLQVKRVYLRREHTVLKTVNWTAWIRATVVSSRELPAASLDGTFKVLGRSGKVYDAHVTPTGPGRSTWQYQVHTGAPTHLPANVMGDLDIWISFDGGAHEELAALWFRDMQLGL